MSKGPTFITALDAGGDGVRLALKDCIDVEGVPTTSGSPIVAEVAGPAQADAACLAGARAAGARIVGKANLHELCFGGSGVNPWFGTPVNPLDPARVPGGSSSGCAVAVATGEADVAFGTDTGGSVRTPSAYCGTVGLKTTWGRLPLAGIQPLAPSMDTVGPMAATVGGVALGMALLDPGFRPAGAAPVIGRVRPFAADEAVDEALDAALAGSGVPVIQVRLEGWDEATGAARTVLVGEAWRTIGHLYRQSPGRVGPETTERFELGAAVSDSELAEALAHRDVWRARLAAAFDRAPVLALPAAVSFAPLLDASRSAPNIATLAINLAGHPALVLPVPTAGPLPAGLQLVAADAREDLLIATAALVEAASGPISRRLGGGAGR